MTAEELKHFPQFADLSSQEIELLLPLFEERGLVPGRRVFNEGEDAHGLVLLTHGAVELKSASGFEATVKAPAAFGGAALVHLGPRLMTARTAEPSTIEVLTRTAFHRFADDAPRAAVRILEAVVVDLASLLRESLEER